MVDIPGSNLTTTSITIGGTLDDQLEVAGDHDWVRIELTAGQTITIALTGSGGSPLQDPYLRLRDSAGDEIAFDDDSGEGLNSLLTFTASTTGTYYIDVGAFGDASQGTYQLSVTTGEPPADPVVYTNDQIADYLINGAYSHGSFNTAPGGTITVNISGLTAEGQLLAREALALWADVISVTFVEVTTDAQITFDDDESGAFATMYRSGDYITRAEVNVSTQWLADYGAGIASYSMQTYLHEIGHALGLGHGGDYNVSADYASDAHYLNDGWPTTIMSYFSQSQNTYFAEQGFTWNFVLTPMVADILAISTLYGASTTTRSGNTTYGFSSTANRDIFNAALHPNVAYTLFDSGGIDTLNYSGYSNNQRINLNAETFSNVGSGVGNVNIARGTVIENAMGGSGNDALIGNSAENVLTGGSGNDLLEGGDGNDLLDGGADNDEIRGGLGADAMSGGAGNDSYYVNEVGDTITELSGEGAADSVRSSISFVLGDHVERLYLTGTDAIDGIGNALSNRIGGNDAANTLDGGGGNDLLNGNGGDDALLGGGGSDLLNGNAGDDTLLGGAGRDQLNGGAGADAMSGGASNDVYYVNDAGDLVTEALREGTDVARASISYGLTANVERLVLTGSAAIDGTGNGMANRINGNGAANRLDGGSGHDQLYGAGGDDRLIGNVGNDTLSGGAGADMFVFDSALNRYTNVDKISDFSVHEDTIELDQTIFTGLNLGTLSAEAFATGTSAQDLDDRIIYDSATGRIYYDADGNGAGAQVLFAQVTAGLALTNADFTIVG